MNSNSILSIAVQNLVIWAAIGFVGCNSPSVESKDQLTDVQYKAMTIIPSRPGFTAYPKFVNNSYLTIHIDAASLSHRLIRIETEVGEELDCSEQYTGLPFYNQDWYTSDSGERVLYWQKDTLWNQQKCDVKISRTPILCLDFQSKEDSTTFGIYNLNTAKFFPLIVSNESVSIELPRLFISDYSSSFPKIETFAFVKTVNGFGQAYLAFLEGDILKSPDGLKIKNIAIGPKTKQRYGVIDHPVNLPDSSILVTFSNRLLHLNKAHDTLWVIQFPRQMLTSKLFTLNDNLAIWMAENARAYVVDIAKGSIVNSFTTTPTPSKLVACGNHIYFVGNNQKLYGVHVDSLKTADRAKQLPEMGSLSRTLGSNGNRLLLRSDSTWIVFDCEKST